MRTPSSCRRCSDQVGKLIHSSNYYLVPLQEQLAAKLCELSGLSNVFFCNSGLEANEAALKIARKFGHDKGIERPEIVVYEAAFHGRSIATLSATGNAKIQAGFGPLVEGFVRVPLNDVAAIENVARTQPERRRRLPRGDPGRRRHPADDDRLPASKRAGSATSAAGC